MLAPGDFAPPFHVEPVFGLPVDSARLPGPLVLCFVRSLASPLTRSILLGLQEAFPRFDLAGVGVLAITDSPLGPARDFVPRHQLVYPLVCDPEQALFVRYGLGSRAPIRAIARTSILGAFRALRHGFGLPESSRLRLPADFVIGPDGRLRHVHYGRSLSDGPDLEALLAAAQS